MTAENQRGEERERLCESVWVFMLEAALSHRAWVLVWMFGVYLSVCVCVCSCVCVYLCLMGRPIEETWGSERRPIGYQESADPDTSTSPLNIYLSFAHILPPCLFFFALSPSFSSSLLFFCSLSIFWRYFLPPSLTFLLLSFALSPSIAFHIYPSLPLPPFSPLSLPPFLHLSLQW